MMEFKEDFADMNATIKTEELQIDSVLSEENTKSNIDPQTADGYISSDEANDLEPEQKSGRSFFECYLCDENINFLNKELLEKHLDEAHSAGELHSCKECTYETKDVFYFNRHLMRHDASKRPFQCSVCLLRFDTDDARMRHENSSHGVENAWSKKYLPPATLRPPFCNVCKMAFEGPAEIVEHIRQDHPDRAHEIHSCDQCEDVYFNRKALLAHQKIHTDRWTCDLCGKRNASRTRLGWHKLRGHGINIGGFDFVKCPLCGKEYKRGVELKLHLNAHKNFQKCDECGQEFARASMLKHHKAVAHAKPVVSDSSLNSQPHDLDTNIISACVVKMEVQDDSFLAPPEVDSNDNDATRNKHQCSICLATFSRNSSRKRHGFRAHGVDLEKESLKQQPAHVKEATQQLFHCSICLTNFTRNSTRRRHGFTVHGLDLDDNSSTMPSTLASMRPPACKLCNEHFQHLQHLVTHFQQVHPEHIPSLVPFTCAFCEDRYPTAESLNSHLTVHGNPVQCNECGKEFPKEVMKNHKRSAHPTFETCPKCGNQIRTTSMSKHVLVCDGKTSPSGLGNQRGIEKADQSEEVRAAKLPCDRCGGLFSPHYLLKHKRSKLCKGKQ